MVIRLTSDLICGKVNIDLLSILCGKIKALSRIKNQMPYIYHINMTTFGERLKKVREALGLDQKAFGKTMGIAGRDTISRWERGLGSPSANKLTIMRQKYRINIDWLISGEGEPFIEGIIQEEETAKRSKFVTIEPVVQLLLEEEERAGVTLSPEQRKAILKILRDLVDQNVRSIRELLGSMRGNDKKEIK